LFGDDKGNGGGWKYMDALHENIAQYTHSGSKPCNMAAAGEFVMGISFEYRGNTNKAKGAPIDLVFPKEGLGWDLEAFAIHKGTKKLEAAKKLADWASSKDAMLLYGKNFAITAQPGIAPPLANVPKDYEARLVKMDFGWAADNRERILGEWTRRYNSKTESR
nr:extracellular solute-binding protein [Pseudomonadota bacterium]